MGWVWACGAVKRCIHEHPGDLALLISKPLPFLHAPKRYKVEVLP